MRPAIWAISGFASSSGGLAGAARRCFATVSAQLRPGHTAIDLGANIGSVTAELGSNRRDLVHAFEPDPETFLHLSTRFAGQKNVILHNAAVGGRDDRVTLYRPASWEDEARRRSASKAISVSEMAARRGFIPSGEVELIDFSRFVSSLQGDIQLVKMGYRRRRMGRARGARDPCAGPDPGDVRGNP